MHNFKTGLITLNLFIILFPVFCRDTNGRISKDKFSLKINSILELSKDMTNNQPMEPAKPVIGYFFKNRLKCFCDHYAHYIKNVKLIYLSNNSDFQISFKNGIDFYFQNGRLLSTEETASDLAYPVRLYYYPKGRITKATAQKKKFPEQAAFTFYKSVYGFNRKQIYANLKTLDFFGFKIKFNKKNGAYDALLKVRDEIARLKNKNPQIRTYLRSLVSISTYRWRYIRNKQILSLHSFGIAIDFLQKRYDKQVYWYWAQKYYPDFNELPFSERQRAPWELIKAFEKHGFIWGGKWYFFDNLHFEYRPELVCR